MMDSNGFECKSYAPNISAHIFGFPLTFDSTHNIFVQMCVLECVYTKFTPKSKRPHFDLCRMIRRKNGNKSQMKKRQCSAHMISVVIMVVR